MKKYSVTLLEHVRHTYEVKANNEEQAVQLACERSDFDDGDVDGQYNGYEIELIEDGVDEEQVRDDFRDWLYSLLHKRFSYEKLIELIREKTGIADLKVYMDIGDDDGTDYHAIFDIQGEHADHALAGEFDIYYLKMREDACEAFGHEERIYITEVGYNFYND
jgi:hypothetical protein